MEDDLSPPAAILLERAERTTYIADSSIANRTIGHPGVASSSVTPHSQLKSEATNGAAVLLVEDNPVSQRIALAMLTSLGCEAHVVDNGREAVAAAASTNFDLILMNCQMPVMDGYEATVAIRAAEVDSGRGTRRVPIVAVTASAMSHDRQRCSDAGMDDYLAKPLRTDELAAVMLRLMGDRTVAASISSRLAELFEGLDGDIVGDSVDLLRSFQRRAAEAIDEIERAVADDDAPATRQHAHSLKGMAGNIGAALLAEDAAEVEDAARDGRMVPRSAIADLRLGLADVERAVAELFPAAARWCGLGPL